MAAQVPNNEIGTASAGMKCRGRGAQEQEDDENHQRNRDQQRFSTSLTACRIEIERSSKR